MDTAKYIQIRPYTLKYNQIRTDTLKHGQIRPETLFFHFPLSNFGKTDRIKIARKFETINRLWYAPTVGKKTNVISI